PPGPPQRLGDQLILAAGKVEVERPPGHAAEGDHLVQPGAGVSPGFDQLLRRVEQPPPRLVTLTSHRIKIDRSSYNAQPSEAALAFDHEDAGLGGRVRDVFVAGFGVADDAGGEAFDVFLAVAAVVHVDRAVEDGEDLGAVVDVPDVRLVGPVQPHGGGVDLGDGGGAPGEIDLEGTGVEAGRPS